MQEAEKVYLEEIGLFPETRIKRAVNFVRDEE
jgi:hypothetical protein